MSSWLYFFSSETHYEDFQEAEWQIFLWRVKYTWWKADGKANQQIVSNQGVLPVERRSEEKIIYFFHCENTLFHSWVLSMVIYFVNWFRMEKEIMNWNDFSLLKFQLHFRFPFRVSCRLNYQNLASFVKLDFYCCG